MNATENAVPGVDEMVNVTLGLLSRFEQARQALKLANLPFVWTEVGVPSYTTAAASPFVFPPDDGGCTGRFQGNQTTQANAFEALLTAALRRNDILRGAFVYGFDNAATEDSFPDGSLYPCFYTPRGKLAMKSISKGFQDLM